MNKMAICGEMQIEKQTVKQSDLGPQYARGNLRKIMICISISAAGQTKPINISA